MNPETELATFMADYSEIAPAIKKWREAIANGEELIDISSLPGYEALTDTQKGMLHHIMRLPHQRTGKSNMEAYILVQQIADRLEKFKEERPLRLVVMGGGRYVPNIVGLVKAHFGDEVVVEDAEEVYDRIEAARTIIVDEISQPDTTWDNQMQRALERIRTGAVKVAAGYQEVVRRVPVNVNIWDEAAPKKPEREYHPNDYRDKHQRTRNLGFASARRNAKKGKRR